MKFKPGKTWERPNLASCARKAKNACLMPPLSAMFSGNELTPLSWNLKNKLNKILNLSFANTHIRFGNRVKNAFILIDKASILLVKQIHRLLAPPVRKSAIFVVVSAKVVKTMREFVSND